MLKLLARFDQVGAAPIVLPENPGRPANFDERADVEADLAHERWRSGGTRGTGVPVMCPVIVHCEGCQSFVEVTG